jgi:Protein of unknown function (DUF1559)/Domain of unknown function (DUF4190)
MSTAPGMVPPPPPPYNLPQTSGMAITSFVLGISSFLCWLATGLPAIILGIVALNKINRSNGRLTGSGFAIAGIVSGAITALVSIPILIALLLPAVQAAREAARRSQSMNNMRQISLGLMNYETTHRALPARGGGDEAKAKLSWRVHVLPYIEDGGAALYDQFHLDEPWDSEHNLALLPFMPTVFKNPNGVLPDGMTNYLLVTGPGTAFPDADVKPQFRDYKDGTSNTILLVEADPSLAVEWTKPDDWQLDPIDPTHDLGSLRPGGFIAVMADGTVRFVRNETDPETVKAMMTPDGQEQVSLP